MKHIYKILFSVLLFSCASHTEKDKQENPETHTVEITQPKYVGFPEKHIGFWVNETYYNSLKTTKSTKQTQELGLDDFYRVSEDQSIMRMNAHDGGGNNILLMTSENEGEICSPDSTEVYSKVSFKDGYMFAENNKYIYTTDMDTGFHELINDACISGKYRNDSNEIVFKANGTILGLDSIVFYELNTDYMDMGMDVDKIYLKYSDDKKSDMYTYSFHSDTLLISEIECVIEEEGYCVVIDKGKTVLTLIKY